MKSQLVKRQRWPITKATQRNWTRTCLKTKTNLGTICKLKQIPQKAPGVGPKWTELYQIGQSCPLLTPGAMDQYLFAIWDHMALLNTASTFFCRRWAGEMLRTIKSWFLLKMTKYLKKHKKLKNWIFVRLLVFLQKIAAGHRFLENDENAKKYKK